MSHNISILWDFDGTLTPQDSTSELIKHYLGKDTEVKGFWKLVNKISGTTSTEPINTISSSDTPVWMYLLAEILIHKKHTKPISLNETGMSCIIPNKVKLYPEVVESLKKLKDLSNEKFFKENKIEVHHFIITAGLRDLISSIIKEYRAEDLITYIFGCRYHTISTEDGFKNIPIYCMDKTSKTRSIFEVQKGCFKTPAKYKVDDLVDKKDEWCAFENMIYIGDGDTDIPAFSLIDSKRGTTIGVYNSSKPEKANTSHNMREGKRIHLFTPANYKEQEELFQFIKNRCYQIAQRISAQGSSLQ